jgi:2-oxoglutarate ferredoxin oxidoreductase subunit gamma
MKQHEFIFAGFGGQGVMFGGQLLAYSAMEAGLEVTWIPSYGPEMRGGTANCTVIISDRPIGSPLVRQPGVAIVFNNPSFEKYAALVTPGGWLVYNASIIDRTTTRKDIHLLPVPASSIADDIGNLKLMNVALLGAMLSVYPVLPLDLVKRTLAANLVHREMLIQNEQALEQGYRAAASS